MSTHNLEANIRALSLAVTSGYHSPHDERVLLKWLNYLLDRAALQSPVRLSPPLMSEATPSGSPQPRQAA